MTNQTAQTIPTIQNVEMAIPRQNIAQPTAQMDSSFNTHHNYVEELNTFNLSGDLTNASNAQPQMHYFSPDINNGLHTIDVGVRNPTVQVIAPEAKPRGAEQSVEPVTNQVETTQVDMSETPSNEPVNKSNAKDDKEPNKAHDQTGSKVDTENQTKSKSSQRSKTKRDRFALSETGQSKDTEKSLEKRRSPDRKEQEELEKNEYNQNISKPTTTYGFANFNFNNGKRKAENGIKKLFQTSSSPKHGPLSIGALSELVSSSQKVDQLAADLKDLVVENASPQILNKAEKLLTKEIKSFSAQSKKVEKALDKLGPTAQAQLLKDVGEDKLLQAHQAIDKVKEVLSPSSVINMKLAGSEAIQAAANNINNSAQKIGAIVNNIMQKINSIGRG